MADFIPYKIPFKSIEESEKSAKQFFDEMNARRSVREFSDKPFPIEIIHDFIKTANTAPSGANKQPWTFCIISNPELKQKIRIEAEKEEYESYNSRMSEEWLKDLEAFGTDWHKPFLEIAPYLIIVFKRVFEFGENDKKHNNYYVNESVGIACGFLLAAIHNAGMVALTHTPSPMNFLSEILDRPKNERPYLLIPVGYPANDVLVPNIHRKLPKDIIVEYL